MIVEWLVAIGAAVVGWVADLLPSWDVPEWISQVDDKVNGLLYVGSGLGAWIDMPTAGIVISAVFVAMGIGFAVKLVLKAAAITHISGSD